MCALFFSKSKAILSQVGKLIVCKYLSRVSLIVYDVCSSFHFRLKATDFLWCLEWSWYPVEIDAHPEITRFGIFCTVKSTTIFHLFEFQEVRISFNPTDFSKFPIRHFLLYVLKISMQIQFELFFLIDWFEEIHEQHRRVSSFIHKVSIDW